MARSETRERRYAFPVAVEWLEGRALETRVPEKEPLRVATPPEFGGAEPTTWSPEDLLVAATASCWAATFLAVAERRGLPVRRLAVDGAGAMGLVDGRLAFTAVELSVRIDTDEGGADAVLAAADRAGSACFVSEALAVPVQVAVHVATDLDRAA